MALLIVNQGQMVINILNVDKICVEHILIPHIGKEWFVKVVYHDSNKIDYLKDFKLEDDARKFIRDLAHQIVDNDIVYVEGA